MEYNLKNNEPNTIDYYEDYYDNVLVKEQPFYRAGMSPEEIVKEQEYLNLNLQKFYEGKYMPLWKQNLYK